VLPQEHGNHTGVKELQVDHALVFRSQEGMDINVSRFTAEQLLQAAHTDEIGEPNGAVVRVDYKNSGLGSNSCGPQLNPRYQMNDDEFHWEFTMGLE